MKTRIHNIRTILLCSALLCAVSAATSAWAEEPESISAIAMRAAGDTPGAVAKTENLAKWINTNFEWTTTDYQKRTPEEIIRRRGGNCAELASVLDTLLNSLNIRHRWMAEINVEPENVPREHRSEELMVKMGNRASVFGLRHNDHRWLEVYDDKNETWFPADPAVGVVGMNQWISARLAMERRTPPPVPAVAEVTKDMLIPFVVVALSSRSGMEMAEDRSTHYLVDGFNAYYGGRLNQLPAWNDWVKAVHDLSANGMSALEGNLDLHKQEGQIEQLTKVYKVLQGQALKDKLINTVAPIE